MAVHRWERRSAGGGSCSTARGRARGCWSGASAAAGRGRRRLAASVLDPLSIPKYVTPLVIPPAMPRSRSLRRRSRAGRIDYYEIAVREFRPAHPAGRAWGWSRPGSGATDRSNHPASFNYPAFTIEADWGRPVRVKWINGLVDSRAATSARTCWRSTRRCTGPTRPAARRGRDGHGSDHAPYRGPVPIVTHLHGGHSTRGERRLPRGLVSAQARNIPAGYARTGSLYQQLPGQGPARARPGVDARQRGLSVRQRSTRHDDVVPRPHARHDPRQRLRRTGRLLPAARRPRRRGRRDAPGSGAGARRPAGARLLRDPDRDPGPLLHRRRLAVLSRQPRLLRGPRPVPAADPVHARPGLRRRERRRADLEPRVLRQRDRRQRRHLALARRAAAALSLPLSERLQLALPDPADVQRAAVLADRQRGRLPAGAGRAARAAARPGRARRRDRRLHERPARKRDHPATTSVRTSRSAAASPASTSSRPTRRRPGR